MTDSKRVLIALGAAILLGILIAGHAPLVHAADFISPFGALWVNAIRMTVIPLVLSLLITGVASVSDVRSIGRLGGRTLAVFLILLAIVAIAVMPLCYALFGFLPKHAGAIALPAGAVEAAGEVSGTSQTFATWLPTLLPSNPIAAAANGAMIPLILFALLFALAVARSPERSRTTLLAFFQAIVDAMLILVRWIIFAAPIGVFALVLPLTAHAGAAVAGGLGFYIVAYSAACVVAIVLLYALVRMRGFARAAFPGQVIAFSSSSSLASLPSLIEAAERDLALPNDVVSFTMPLAASMFKIAAPVTWTVGAYFVSWFYGVPIGPGQLAIIAFAALFLGFAAPGIPRGGFIMLAPLFIAIGLPVEGIGILIAVDALPDTFASALNATGILAATALVARSETG